MSKTMQWAWDEAEKYSDKLVDKIKAGHMTIAQAADDLINSNQSYQLLGIDSHDQAEEMFWYATQEK